ncbi:MAG TPA: NrfD/PsrC family molybdoenzyme membrane anchor subunit [Acidothermaceae bacterium]|nr:NrfD/PsrC family molybdoenzyme membrane anchor subunit [Acidothermaceae bacterium]
MSTSDVTKDGIQGVKPGRDAMVGVVAGRQDGARGGRRRGGEQSMVPEAKFASYYGKPVLNAPVWKAPDIAGYFFLGGLAGASSVIGACASATGRPALARASKVGALVSISLGMVGLVHDLGKPSRFVNMLRVFKPTSPMSVGSWALAGYGPAAGAAAFSAVTGRMKGLGAVATGTAAAIGPFVASYTAALMCNTAVPSWHEAYREMPFVFVGSGATAAGGLGILAAPVAEAGPARRTALFGAALELAASQVLTRRLPEPLSEPYGNGKSGARFKLSEALTAAGAAGSVVLGRRSRAAAVVSGLALLAGSALSRFAIFEAGMVSANDPEHTVRPQRERLNAKLNAKGEGQ